MGLKCMIDRGRVLNFGYLGQVCYIDSSKHGVGIIEAMCSFNVGFGHYRPETLNKVCIETIRASCASRFQIVYSISDFIISNSCSQSHFLFKADGWQVGQQDVVMNKLWGDIVECGCKVIKQRIVYPFRFSASYPLQVLNRVDMCFRMTQLQGYVEE